jgi:hypothetical protein
MNPLIRLLHSTRGWSFKTVERHEEYGDIERVAAEDLGVGCKRWIPASIFDLPANLIALFAVSVETQAPEPVSTVHFEEAVQRHPAHQPRMGEVLPRASRLPYSIVRFMPMAKDVFPESI